MTAARCVRTERFLYVRNFFPHRGWNQYSNWADAGAINHEFYPLRDSESVASPIQHFVRTTRAVEELYDCQADPLNLHNLADSAEHLPVLSQLREHLDAHMISSNDIGFVPEPLARRYADRSGADWVHSSDVYTTAAREAARESGTATEEVLLAHLNSNDPSLQ